MPITLRPKIEPEHWRRCIECRAKLVRVMSDDHHWNIEQLNKHPGHHFVQPVGVHIGEFIRICLGLL